MSATISTLSCLKIIATIFSILLGLLVYRLYQNLFYWRKRKIFGVKTNLLIGSLPKTFLGKCSISEELNEIYLQHKSKYQLVGIFNGMSPKFLILNPELAAEILKKKFHNFHDNEASKWTSSKVEINRNYSPLVSTGDDWKNKRSELTPALKLSRLRESAYPALRVSATKLISFIEINQKMGLPLDITEIIYRYTTDFTTNLIWSIESDAFGDTACIYYKIGIRMLFQATRCVNYFSATNILPWLRRFWPVRFFPQQAERFFRDTTHSTLKTRLDGHMEHNDIFNYFVQLRSKKTLDDMKFSAHISTIFFDSFGSSASVIAHCLLLLSRESRVQKKLHKELQAYEDLDGEQALEKLEAFTYLDQCINETLRIFPLLTPFSKLCTERITVDLDQSNAITFEKGDIVYIPPFSFHRDADFFENPEKFWPERFDEERGGVKKYRNQGTFLPFSDGPRMCMGMRMGLLQTKVAVAEVIRNFEVVCSSCTRTDNKIAPNEFVTSLEGGIRLYFKKRELRTAK